MDIAILSPIEVEYKAVRPYLSDIKKEVKDGFVYEIGNFIGQFQMYRVVIRQTGSKIADIALATEKLVHAFRPAAIFLVGVAGGVKDVSIGDVVVGTKAYDFQGGKVLDDHFATRPDVIPYDMHLIDHARHITRQDDWEQTINGWVRGHKIVFGPIGCSDKVIASTASPEYALIKRHYNDTTALEMEAIGFAKAAFAYKEIRMMNIRGISDLLDHKNAADAGGSQQLAAAQAAAFTFGLLHQLDFKHLKIYAIDPKLLVQRVWETAFPLLTNAETPGSSNHLQGEIWEKVKPLLAEEMKELQQAPDNEEILEEVKFSSRKKLRTAIEGNAQLLQELQDLLQNADNKGVTHKTTIENSKNVLGNSSINAGGNVHIGDIIHIQQPVTENNPPNSAPTFNADTAGTLRKLIGNNKIKQALEQLLQHTNGKHEDIYAQAVQYSQQWNKLQKQETLGILTSSEASTAGNKIVYGLLELISELEQGL